MRLQANNCIGYSITIRSRLWPGRLAGPVFLLALTLLNSCTLLQPEALPAVVSRPKNTLTPTPYRLHQAMISDLVAEVRARNASFRAMAPAVSGTVISIGGLVETGVASRARVTLADGAIIRLDENSSFELTEMELDSDWDPITTLKLLGGRVWAQIKGGSLEIETPNSVASVRGSKMGVGISETGDVVVTNLEGAVKLEVGGVSVDVGRGEQALIPQGGGAPVVGPMDQAQLEAWVANNPEAISDALTLFPKMRLVLPTRLPTNTAMPGLVERALGALDTMNNVAQDRHATPLPTRDLALIGPVASAVLPTGTPVPTRIKLPLEATIPATVRPLATAMPTAQPATPTQPPTAAATATFSVQVAPTSTVPPTAQATAAALIVCEPDMLSNASFESGDFKCWNLEKSDPDGTWGLADAELTVANGAQVYDYASKRDEPQVSPGLPDSFAVTEGRRAAFVIANKPGTFRAYQDVKLRACATGLTWDMQYATHSANGLSTREYVAVDIRSPDADTRQVALFVATAGRDAASTSSKSYQADLTKYAGQAIRFDIEIVSQSGQFEAGFDNFKITGCN